MNAFPVPLGMLSGHASAPGTVRYAARFPTHSAVGFYRKAQSLNLSNLGIGTYLGEMNEATDRGYAEAVGTALSGGVNFIDTSLNYRNQRSERSIGTALRQAAEAGRVQRDEVVICTKAGYLVPDAIPKGVLAARDVVGGMHSMAPDFLADQLSRSRENLEIETIDVFYLHNPETQLGYIGPDEFYSRVHQAFIFLEEAVEQGGIQFYGAATWEGFRRPSESPEALSLQRLEDIAREAGGDGHHFRFIQLPVNLAMPQAFADRVDGESVLDVAARLGITAVASASLLQARLTRNLPSELRTQLPGTRTDAQCAIQFARSTPGITVALVGMSNPVHVRENMELAAIPPATTEEYLGLFKS
jgi:aryl-alcohol dehydrogenase-like predicted oxidoreductase